MTILGTNCFLVLNLPLADTGVLLTKEFFEVRSTEAKLSSEERIGEILLLCLAPGIFATLSRFPD